MNSEKVKEIKKALECCQGESLKSCEHCHYWNWCKEDDGLTFKSDILTLINELESENARLKQSNKNILFVNDKVIERNQELEETLLDMVVQFCQMGEEGYLKHIFMSAEEQAFNVLDIQYGEKVDDVYKRFFKRWGREWEE